jgi:hypothetical protein
MKKKAILVVLLCVMGLAAVSIGNADAAPWYTCTISQAGANNAGYYVLILTDTASPVAFTNRTFLISPTNSHQKEMYAAALTAFANSTYVVVNLPSISASSFCTALYAQK